MIRPCAIFPREEVNPAKGGGVEPGPLRLRATVKRSARPPMSQRESVGSEQGGLVPPPSRDERMSVRKMQTCHAIFTFSQTSKKSLKMQDLTFPESKNALPTVGGKVIFARTRPSLARSHGLSRPPAPLCCTTAALVRSSSTALRRFSTSPESKNALPTVGGKVIFARTRPSLARSHGLSRPPAPLCCTTAALVRSSSTALRRFF